MPKVTEVTASLSVAFTEIVVSLDMLDKSFGEIFFITGADCLISIEKWKEVAKIFSLCTFVVFTRGGFDINEIITKKKEVEEIYGKEILVLELKELEISSTDIRKRVKDGKKIDFFVPEKVNQFIIENNLYKE